MRYLRFFLWLPVFSVLLTYGCATNPVTRRAEFVLMSEQQEIETGKQLSPEIEKIYGVYQSEDLQQYVNTIGMKIARVSDRPDILYNFTVLDSPIVNAFALPGGYIFITRGLMSYMNSEAELAGVLAHETGHVTARHSVRQYTTAATYQIGAGIASIFIPEAAKLGEFANVVFTAVSSGYSRAYETEADSLALKYAEYAGYNICAVSSMLKTLNLLDRYSGNKQTHTSLFATHPETEKRITDVNNGEMCSGSRSGPSDTARLNYLKRLDGLVFGDDPTQGILVGNRFIHQELKCELTFPQGWKVSNMPQSVTAADKKGEAFAEFAVYALSEKKRIDEAASIISKKYGLKKVSGKVSWINDLEAYSGTYISRSRGLGDITVRLGCFINEGRIFYILGFTKTENFYDLAHSFENIINSFRTLSSTEAAKVRPNRISLYTVKKGDTLPLIIKKLRRSKSEIETVALLNAWDPEKLPVLSEGMIIKVVKQ